MADAFATSYSQLDSPAKHAAAVVPSDAADLPNASRAIYVGTTGDLKVTMVGGETVTFKTVPVGVLHLRIARVWSTGTTATNLVVTW